MTEETHEIEVLDYNRIPGSEKTDFEFNLDKIKLPREEKKS